MISRIFPAPMILTALAVAALSCSLWAPPDQPRGRNIFPPGELLVVHGLGETLSAIELDEQGAFLDHDPDIISLGAVPNALTSDGDELAVTLSGENSLLFLDKKYLKPGDPPAVALGSGVNPMHTVVLKPGLYGTTGFFTTRVHLSQRNGGEPFLSEPLNTGPAPQAVIVLPGEGLDNQMRLVIANTGYSSTRPASSPFGPASLSLFVLSITGAPGAWEVTVAESVLIDLEAPDHDEQQDSGLNPVALIDTALIDPAVNEILVICSGVNYGSGNTNDGTLLVLDRTTLAVTRRIFLGGSPGAGVMVARSGGSHTLFTVGTKAIRSLDRAGDGSGWDENSLRIEYTAGGGLPFLADIAVRNDSLYAADFGNDQILRFKVDGEGGLKGPEEILSVSDGPAVLMIQEH